MQKATTPINHMSSCFIVRVLLSRFMTALGKNVSASGLAGVSAETEQAWAIFSADL
jgi:hypothetical protein